MLLIGEIHGRPVVHERDLTRRRQQVRPIHEVKNNGRRNLPRIVTISLLPHVDAEALAAVAVHTGRIHLKRDHVIGSVVVLRCVST